MYSAICYDETLNIFKTFLLESNLFGPELFTFSKDFIDRDN